MTKTTAINDDFLGMGWSFPPNFDAGNAGVDMTEKMEDIHKSLEILLTTTIGERVMEPKYGCNMADLLFEPLNTTTITIMKDRIQTAILYFEPRIDAKNIELSTDDELEGVVLISVEYIVRSTNSRFNFVYPYYKDEGTELQMVTTNTQTA
jgi:hypothetical protein